MIQMRLDRLPAMAPADFFPPPGKPGFASRSKKAGRRHPSLSLRA
jgi:hypothetical protein